MRVVNLKPFEQLIVPRNQGELMRSLNQLATQVGAARFGYIQLPTPFDLLQVGVYPRVLSNFPDHIMQAYIAVAQQPFSMVIRALSTKDPVFLSDALLPEGVYLQKLCYQAGLREGIMLPIHGASNAAFLYMFEQPVEKTWATHYLDTPMAQIAEMVHLAVTARTSLCPDFQVPGFTPRMKEIMQFKAYGYTNEATAARLGVKPDTIKKAIRRFSERLGGLSTAELIHHLTKMGML